MFDRQEYLARVCFEDIAGEPPAREAGTALAVSSEQFGAALSEPEHTSLYDWSLSQNAETMNMQARAIRERWVTPYQMPERTEQLAREAFEILDAAKRKGKESVSLAALKVIRDLNNDNAKLVKDLDKAGRLDEGKPTSIVQQITPEIVQKVRQIVSTQRKSLPPELVARAALKAQQEASVIENGGAAE